jgi:hypothetical protein
MADLVVIYAEQIFIVSVAVLGAFLALLGLKRLLRGKKMFGRKVYKLRED